MATQAVAPGSGVPFLTVGVKVVPATVEVTAANSLAAVPPPAQKVPAATMHAPLALAPPAGVSSTNALPEFVTTS